MNPEQDIQNYLNSFNDWRGDRLKQLRTIIRTAAPELTEDFKWGVPVWSRYGLVCAISGHKEYVKINFFKGVYLPDPQNLFNSGLDSKVHRSINIHAQDEINTASLQALIKVAAEYKK